MSPAIVAKHYMSSGNAERAELQAVIRSAGFKYPTKFGDTERESAIVIERKAAILITLAGRKALHNNEV